MPLNASVCYRAHSLNDQEAETLLMRALSVSERALGPDYPYTKSTREALNALRSRRLLG